MYFLSKKLRKKYKNVSKHAIIPFPLIAININHKRVQSNFDLVMCLILTKKICEFHFSPASTAVSPMAFLCGV